MEASILLVQSDNLVHRTESFMAFILKGKCVLIWSVRHTINEMVLDYRQQNYTYNWYNCIKISGKHLFSEKSFFGSFYLLTWTPFGKKEKGSNFETLTLYMKSLDHDVCVRLSLSQQIIIFEERHILLSNFLEKSMIQKIEFSKEYNLVKVTDLGYNV